MSAKRLYLIRVSYQKILGPYTLEQLAEVRRNLSFGLRDEVCGNLGNWVNFDDYEGICSEYPELADFVRKELLAGWQVATKPLALHKSGQQKSRDWLIPAIILAIILGAAAAFYRRQIQQAAKPLFPATDVPLLDQGVIPDFTPQ